MKPVITPDLLNETLEYLQSQPYREVKDMLDKWAEALKQPDEDKE